MSPTLRPALPPFLRYHKPCPSSPHSSCYSPPHHPLLVSILPIPLSTSSSRLCSSSTTSPPATGFGLVLCLAPSSPNTPRPKISPPAPSVIPSPALSIPRPSPQPFPPSPPAASSPSRASTNTTQSSAPPSLSLPTSRAKNSPSTTQCSISTKAAPLHSLAASAPTRNFLKTPSCYPPPMAPSCSSFPKLSTKRSPRKIATSISPTISHFLFSVPLSPSISSFSTSTIRPSVGPSLSSCLLASFPSSCSGVSQISAHPPILAMPGTPCCFSCSQSSPSPLAPSSFRILSPFNSLSPPSSS